MDSNETLSIKLVVVGDGSVGKTCILLSYTTDKFPKDYVPTVFENYNSRTQVDGKMVNLSLWDTAGQEAYSNLRTLSYGQADIFLIVFSVTDALSFDNAVNKWYKELSDDELAKVPKIFIGNKIDLRSPSNETHIQKESVHIKLQQPKASKIIASKSALTQQGLKEIFIEATRASINASQEEEEGFKRNREQSKQMSSTGHQEKSEGLCCSIM